MKNIYILILLISNFIFSQNNDSKWNQIIELENEDKIKTALEIVDHIYKKSLKRNDEVQIIKCFFYKSKYLQIVDENAQSKILDDLKLNIAKVSVPSKALLNLVYAKCLKDYLSDYRNKIYSRTKIDSVASKEVLSWTSDDFKNEIEKLYLKSTENEDVLKNTPLIKYEQIFDFLSIDKFKTMNVLEYILQEKINYYKTNLSGNLQLQELYSKKDVLFSNSENFTKLNLDFIKNHNVKLILSYFQKLEISNSFDNQFERLKTLNYLINSATDYQKALNNLQKKTIDDYLRQKIMFEKAIYLKGLANKKSDINYNSKTIEVLDSILNIKNRSNTFGLATREKNQIISKSLHVQLQKYTYPNENTRAFVTYKNIEKFSISFYKISVKNVEDLKNTKLNKDSIISLIKTKNRIEKEIGYNLINKKDYFEYSTEILLPHLETGNYFIYFESETENSIKAFGVETITVSNFTVLANKKDYKYFYQVLDRKTGKPIENVILKNKYLDIKTNKNGLAIFETSKNDNSKLNNENIDLYKENDTLQIYANYVTQSEDYTTEKIINHKAKVFLYLDRAIYRPGQTVYYKGITVEAKGVTKNTVPRLLIKIIITDADDNDFKEFEVTTNEFGSFSGEFVLPKNALTGEFKIEADEPDDYEKCNLYDKKKDEHPFWDNVDFETSEISFKVEEYKRPKFEVTFNKVKDDFLVNQKITVNGLAKAFSGSNITDAKVTYTVERKTYRYNYSTYSDNNKEIKNGETKTDANGKFNIEFITEPEEDVEKENLPIFEYTIEVSITDINGETRSNKTTIKVAYHTLVLDTYIPKIVDLKAENKINLNSTNLNGEFLAANGEIKIYFKKEYDAKIKQRVFQKPELDGFTDQEFNILFPFEQNEQEIIKQEIGTLVYSKNINTAIDKEIALNFIKTYKPGYYSLVFSAKDKYENIIENKKDFQIIDRSKATLNKLVTIEQLNKSPKKDGFIMLKILSNQAKLYLFSSAVYKNLVYDQQNIKLLNGQVVVKIPIKKEFESSVKIGFESVFENQYFNDYFEVHFTNETESIIIETETFRNKIEPGNKEFWSFKLKHKNGFSESELLASMYDKSLDEFTKKDWETMNFYKYDYNYLEKRTSLGFERIYASIKNLNLYSGIPKSKNEETKMIWFGFDFNSNYNYYKSDEYKRQLTKKIKKPKNSDWITGYVSDNLGHLPGVNVVIKKTMRGVSSDFDGYFEIEAAKGETIIFSFLGMDDKKIIVSDDKEYEIVMNENESQLQEVVFTALGIRNEKKSLGYSVSMIQDFQIGLHSNTDFYSTIAGRVAGINVNYVAGGASKIVIRGSSSLTENNEVLYIVDGIVTSSIEVKSLNLSDILSVNLLKNQEATALYGSKGRNGVILITTKKAMQELTQVKARKNLSETAFFLPHLKSDKSGNLSFNFVAPEALTEWKLRLFAHNKSGVSGYLQKSVVTQKDLMVTPNFPRFFREKDSITITAKVANITGIVKTGIAVLQFYDASNIEAIDRKMSNSDNIKNFNIPAFGNTTVSWKVYIPEGLQGVQYKILAKSGNFSDGEENILPVLTNNILVTESIPIWVRENSKKEYSFDNLKNNQSTTLHNHQFTLEYTSNPTWLAIQSLPYLMEYEHGCAEQTFARFYSNAIASDIINSNPKIANVFDALRNKSPNNKLEENEELKSIILAETPWFNDVKSEEEKKKKMALLFDLEKMKNSQDAIFDLLKQKQKLSGGFTWFGGDYENEYITRHILAGFGHLKKLSEKSNLKEKITQISINGIPFIDKKFLESNKKTDSYFETKRIVNWENRVSEYHYLYTRSFYLDDYPLSDSLKKVTQKYLKTTKENWMKLSLYEKGLAALILNRFGDTKTAKIILESLKETASNDQDSGMYWIENKSGWYWYQAPIEIQALLIEAFAEIDNDIKSVDAMKVWLLKNRQTTNWATTKATTEAVYALLMRGTNWLSVKDNTIFKIGNEKITTKKLSENQKEAETGYLKLIWKANEIKKEMATIVVENKSKVPGFGGAYWQYFEDLDKIKNDNKDVLSVSKELYIKKNTAKGAVLEKITSNNILNIGDLLTVRLIISSKEDMEFVHLKDMRASCFEPIDVISEYQYKFGLAYYMSTKDAATHLFFDNINKGTYVLEYEIRVNNAGEFSNGITTIQSMYAPEFSSHTKGIRITTK